MKKQLFKLQREKGAVTKEYLSLQKKERCKPWSGAATLHFPDRFLSIQLQMLQLERTSFKAA